MVHEAIHSLKITKNPGMLVKLDITKYYDNLSWKYMRDILRDFGFRRDYVELVMHMVLYTFYSIMLNGSPTRTLNLTQGIHQGDPLSPFLFIIMEEWINNLI